jgi:hypothetical protein
MPKALVGEGPESSHPGPSGQISQGAWIRRVLVFPYLAVIVHPPRQARGARGLVPVRRLRSRRLPSGVLPVPPV